MKVIETGVKLPAGLEDAPKVYGEAIRHIREQYGVLIEAAIAKGNAQRVKELELQCQQSEAPYIKKLVEIQSLGTPFMVVSQDQ